MATLENISNYICFRLFLLLACILVSKYVVAQNVEYTQNSAIQNIVYADSSSITYHYDNKGNLIQKVYKPNPTLFASVFLEGPLDTSTYLMADSLRTKGQIPLKEPFSTLGFSFTHDFQDATIDSSVLLTTGPKAIVDWVFVELRDKNDSTSVIYARSALVQRDGDIVDLDGTSPLRLTYVVSGEYYVAIRHRNHLGVMTLTPVGLSSGENVLDFTDTLFQTFGTDAQKRVGSQMCMWAGNATPDQILKLLGSGSDRFAILARIGGSNLLNVISGYYTEDVNLDGYVKYEGLNNDKDVIFRNIPNAANDPLSTRQEQLPR